MVAGTTPTIAKIKNGASETDARALLYIAICEVCDFFNVGKTMNDVQVAMTVDLIIEKFWYLRLDEIKYCFRRAMCKEKLYDRLDGGIILGWLDAYDAERTEQAIDISHNTDIEAQQRVCPSPAGVDFKTYLAELKQRAEVDKEAAELLANYSLIQSTPSIRKMDKQRSDDFKKWRLNYLLRKSETE